MADIRCTTCGNPYPENHIVHVCEKCRGIFDFDTAPFFEDSRIDRKLPGMWKYWHSFSLDPSSPVITLGEGDTPLIWENSATKEVGFKLESLNPTGSYKDRGTAVLLSQMVFRGVKTSVEDSSGNAGASFAAYCARAGIKARVFVPEGASGPKTRQIKEYGADLIRVPGPRSEAARAVLKSLDKDSVYGSHAYLPFGIPGIATIAYELFEQTGGQVGSVIAPAGHGALLLGMIRGFQAIKNAGKCSRLPYFVGVQAENCSPMAMLYNRQITDYADAPEGITLAEGVRVSRPVRGYAIIKEMGDDAGEIISIEEEKIITDMKELSEIGIYSEPTSALVWSACKKLEQKLPRPIILIISGNGLKYYPT